MKKLFFLIILCLFSISNFAQQKKLPTQKPKSSFAKKKNIHSVGNKLIYKMCEACDGTGKHLACVGTGKCQNHTNYHIDQDCYEELFDTECSRIYSDEGYKKDCVEGVIARCEIICSKCGNKEGTCPSYSGLCEKGNCTVCNGTGKIRK